MRCNTGIKLQIRTLRGSEVIYDEKEYKWFFYVSNLIAFFTKRKLKLMLCYLSCYQMSVYKRVFSPSLLDVCCSEGIGDFLTSCTQHNHKK